MSLPRFDGAVLCGGESRRMGRDKALLNVDGEAMAGRVAACLADAGADDIVTVGGDGPALTALGLRWTPDRWPGGGPLGGIVTALEVARADVVVVLSCDLVTPDPAAVVSLVAALADRDADLAVPVVGDRRQWTHAAWSRRVRRLLADVYRSGERAVHAATTGLVRVEVHGVDPAATADADTPADLP